MLGAGVSHGQDINKMNSFKNVKMSGIEKNISHIITPSSKKAVASFHTNLSKPKPSPTNKKSKSIKINATATRTSDREKDKIVPMPRLEKQPIIPITKDNRPIKKKIFSTN